VANSQGTELHNSYATLGSKKVCMHSQGTLHSPPGNKNKQRSSAEEVSFALSDEPSHSLLDYTVYLVNCEHGPEPCRQVVKVFRCFGAGELNRDPWKKRPFP
jgi:hypothetical protein